MKTINNLKQIIKDLYFEITGKCEPAQCDCCCCDDKDCCDGNCCQC